MYRRFTLVNSKNETWSFTDKEFKVFLNNPQGLGFNSSLDVIRYGEKGNVSSETFNFPTPSGDILFYDSSLTDKYSRYFNFARFIADSPLKLYYTLPSGFRYELDCYVTSLSKGEVDTNNILTCPINFQGISFWKADEIVSKGTDSFFILNNGDFPVGFEILIEGDLMNPYVLLSQDGELYGEAKFDDQTAFNSVYINSNDGEQSVILEQGGSVLPNPLSYQDLSISNGSIYVTFVKLARGKTDLTIGVESGSITSSQIRYTPQYRSV